MMDCGEPVDDTELDMKLDGLMKAFKKITDFAASIDDFDEGHEYASKEVAEARRAYGTAPALNLYRYYFWLGADG